VAIKVVLKPLRRHLAHGMAQGQKVWVDPRTPNILRVFLHELIHVEQPELSETATIHETTRRWRKMSWRDKARLLKMFGKAHVGEPDEED
jgi:hypothetical protein